MNMKEQFITLVGLSVALGYESEFIPKINEMMKQGRSRIMITGCFYNSFELIKQPDSGSYRVQARVGLGVVEGLSDVIIAEFTKELYVKYYEAVKKSVGELTLERIESAIWDELNGDSTEIKFKKNWMRKVLGAEIVTSGRLTRWFSIRLAPDDQTVHDGTKIVFSIDEASMIDLWGSNNPIPYFVRDNWYLPEQSIVLQNSKLHESNSDYYKQVLTRLLTKELMKRLKSQVL